MGDKYAFQNVAMPRLYTDSLPTNYSYISPMGVRAAAMAAQVRYHPRILKLLLSALFSPFSRAGSK